MKQGFLFQAGPAVGIAGSASSDVYVERVAYLLVPMVTVRAIQPLTGETQIVLRLPLEQARALANAILLAADAEDEMPYAREATDA